ncbi:hypothetical protein Tsubulata_038016 [Turnera subulata]|uniref:F-box domain-containing protein n=1 Tax=Turnera subulata TaxID=218843 RepID=A0A9Q0GD93_9ROSI|nr:hypothetical protein Tsubulata_038016 [Turnera subulata]
MSSSEKQENTSSMEMKHNNTRAHDNNRLLVDQAKSTNTDQLVMPTNMAAAAAPNRSCLPPDILEEILDLLPKKSIERFRSVSKSLFSLLTIKFTLPKLLHYPCITNFPPSCGVKSSDDKDLFTGVVFSEYSGGGDISPDYESSSFGVVGEYLCFSHSEYGYKDTIWVMKEYCNEASWVPFITYSTLRFTFPHQHCKDREGRVEYVCDFIPGSFKDGRFMMLQFCLLSHSSTTNSNQGKKHVASSSKNTEGTKTVETVCLPTKTTQPKHCWLVAAVYTVGEDDFAKAPAIKGGASRCSGGRPVRWRAKLVDTHNNSPSPPNLNTDNQQILNKHRVLAHVALLYVSHPKSAFSLRICCHQFRKLWQRFEMGLDEPILAVVVAARGEEATRTGATRGRWLQRWWRVWW